MSRAKWPVGDEMGCERWAVRWAMGGELRAVGNEWWAVSGEW